MNKNNSVSINLHAVIAKLYGKKNLYYICIPIVFIVSCIYIFSLPRYYQTDTKLAPEVEGDLGGGTLGSIASSMGLDLSNMSSSDAITPLLYPELMKDDKFICNLLSIKVMKSDDNVSTSYYDYLINRQKSPWWSNIFSKEKKDSNVKIDPYQLTKDQFEIVELVRNNVSLSSDLKNGVLTISTQDQDPLICKTLADSIRVKLQEFITEYRTNKARKDVEYYEKLAMDAKRDYEKSRQVYSSFSDSNADAFLQSIRSKQEDLENEMQLRYNAYTNFSTQLQASMAKLQERTPAFTILKGASVPVKPAGPKRVIFVLGMMIFAFVVLSIWILRKDIPTLLAER